MELCTTLTALYNRVENVTVENGRRVWVPTALSLASEVFDNSSYSPLTNRENNSFQVSKLASKF